jgi:creatinine deaminase
LAACGNLLVIKAYLLISVSPGTPGWHSVLLFVNLVIRIEERNIQNPPVHVLSMGATSEDEFMEAAIEEAKKGLAEGGIPIGSVLVIDGRIVGRGHNRRVQKGSAVLHAEMDCLENAGRLPARDYRRAVLYSTLSPCDMCSGAVLLYKIPRIVIGENRTFQGPEGYLRSRGVELVIMEDEDCVRLMHDFIAANPDLWDEDIGEE